MQGNMGLKAGTGRFVAWWILPGPVEDFSNRRLCLQVELIRSLRTVTNCGEVCERTAMRNEPGCADSDTWCAPPDLVPSS